MGARAAGRRGDPAAGSSTPSIALAGERPFAEISLDDVATGAGVSVQTVLRRFGSRDRLIADAMDVRHRRASRDERRTPPGDVDAAVGPSSTTTSSAATDRRC